jgi:hypothetical protein
MMKAKRAEQIMNQLLGISIMFGGLGLMAILAAVDGDLRAASLGTASLIIAGMGFFSRFAIELFFLPEESAADVRTHP